MTEAVQVALIVTVPATITAIIGVIAILRKQGVIVKGQEATAKVAASVAADVKQASNDAALTAAQAKGVADKTELLVNSRLSDEIKKGEAAVAEAKALQKRVWELEQEISKRYEK